MLELRLLTPADAAIFRDLRLRALREDPVAFTSSTEEFSHQALDTIAARFRSDPAESFMLGAFQERKLVGLVGFYRESRLKLRHKGSIISMYVAAEARGQGLGRSLLCDAIRRVREIQGVENLLLGVMTTQTAARNLYESLGFEVYGREARALCLDGQYYDEEFRVLDFTGESTMNVFVIAGVLFLIGTVAAYTWLTRREAPKA